jgi:hypothetical protein
VTGRASHPRTPTEKQYRLMRCLGGGAALVVGRKRDVEPLLRHGWVTAEKHPDEENRYYAFVRLTGDGLRALALAVERYGWPSLDPRMPT